MPRQSWPPFRPCWSWRARARPWPSAAIGRAAREEGFPLTNFGDLRYTGWGGGVPIIYRGQVVGAVGVSGLPEAEDVRLADLGAAVIRD